MGATLSARFETRRDAEMAVERLVQEHGIERTDIFISAAGAANSAGEQIEGADAEAGGPSTEARGDAQLNGPIEVSVDIQEESKATTIRRAFAEFDARAVAQD